MLYQYEITYRYNADKERISKTTIVGEDKEAIRKLANVLANNDWDIEDIQLIGLVERRINKC